MKTPVIREICGVHSGIYYDGTNIDKVIDELRIIMTDSILPTLDKYKTTCLWFFNKNEEILESMKADPDKDHKIGIDLAIYDDSYKSAYLDITTLSKQNRRKLKLAISKLMFECGV